MVDWQKELEYAGQQETKPQVDWEARLKESRSEADQIPGQKDFVGPIQPSKEEMSKIELEQLPETRQTSDIADLKRGKFGLNSLKAAAGLMFTFDDEARKNVIKDAIPSAKFYERDGYTVVDIDGTRSILNKPGMSGQDAVTALTNVLLFVPAAKMASLGKNLLAKLGLGAAASGVTDAAQQGIEKSLGSGQDYDPKRTAMVAVLGGAAEGVGPLLKGAKEMRRGRIAAKEAGIAAEEVGENIARETGIELLPAQRTGDTKALAMQADLAKDPALAETAAKALKTQDVQVGSSAEKFLQNLKTSPGELKRVTDDPKKLRELTQKIFSKGTSPKEIVIVKNRIAPKNPEVWKDILRNEVENRLGKLTGELAEQGPDKIKKAVFGNNNQKQTLYAAADPQTAKSLKWFETGLDAAGKGRPKGAIVPETKKGIAAAIKNSSSPFDVYLAFMSPKYLAAKKTTEVGLKALANRKNKALAKVFFDPKYVTRREKIRRAGKGRKSAQLFRKLLDNAFKETTKVTARAEAQGD